MKEERIVDFVLSSRIPPFSHTSSTPPYWEKKSKNHPQQSSPNASICPDTFDTVAGNGREEERRSRKESREEKEKGEKGRKKERKNKSRGCVTIAVS